jgi:hypothetical protein
LRRDAAMERWRSGFSPSFMDKSQTCIGENGDSADAILLEQLDLSRT